MILKFNCSSNYFNELYTERNSEKFNQKIYDVFSLIEGNNNKEINQENYLQYNTSDYFYISISDLEKNLKDIERKNHLLSDEILVDLLEHCHNIYNLNVLIEKLEQLV